MSTETKRIALDRRVCVVREGRIDVRPERGAILGPLLGLGTVELAPFWKIDRLEVQDLPLGDVTPKGPPPPLDLRAWDIVLVKTSGKQLSIGQVVAANAPDLLDQGFDRALD